MTILVSDHVEPDTRERILVVAERLFRQMGYQKTTVADIAKELRMSPANVYRFFDSKKSIHEGVARGLMGEVEVEAQRIARTHGPARSAGGADRAGRHPCHDPAVALGLLGPDGDHHHGRFVCCYLPDLAVPAGPLRALVPQEPG